MDLRGKIHMRGIAVFLVLIVCQSFETALAASQASTCCPANFPVVNDADIFAVVYKQPYCMGSWKHWRCGDYELESDWIADSSLISIQIRANRSVEICDRRYCKRLHGGPEGMSYNEVNLDHSPRWPFTTPVRLLAGCSNDHNDYDFGPSSKFSADNCKTRRIAETDIKDGKTCAVIFDWRSCYSRGRRIKAGYRNEAWEK